jgi:hypothetical protein
MQSRHGSQSRGYTDDYGLIAACASREYQAFPDSSRRLARIDRGHAVEILKNQLRDQIATKIDLSGSFQIPTWIQSQRASISCATPSCGHCLPNLEGSVKLPKKQS